MLTKEEKMKNNIGKLTLISTLFLSTVATTVQAQNFYTCVPKESYIKDLAKQTKRSDEEVRKLAREELKNDNDIQCLKNKIKCEENNKKKDICYNNCVCGKNECLEPSSLSKIMECFANCKLVDKQDCGYCF